MLSQIIQRQIPIGSTVVVALKDGREISGVLVEIGRDHITLDNAGELMTILLEIIGTWRVPKEAESVTREQPPVSKTLSDSTPKPSPSESTDQEVIKKLLEIETLFQAQQQVASIQLGAPDFVFPVDEIQGKQNANALTVWNRVKDKYLYAEKINELSSKFGRIQPLVSELASLAERFPHSASIKRHLAYFYHLLGDHQKSLVLFKETASVSSNELDWYNLAAKALTIGDEGLACYSLGRFFQMISEVEASHTWYVYIRLIRKFSDYQTIRELVQRKAPNLSEKEQELLLETGIYLLTVTGHNHVATDTVQRWMSGYTLKDLVSDVFAHFQEQQDITYQEIATGFVKEKIPEFTKTSFDTPQGFIYSYKRDRSFGFLEGSDGETYFFHITAVSDDDLLEQLRDFSPGKKISVTFEPSQGPKGPIAIRVALHRTLDQMFARAVEYANDGDYSKAIALVKRVLDANPDFPSAQDSYDKWREYARASGIPRGSNPYAQAKRVQLIEKDLDRAAQLLRDAIKQGDTVESAVKDLAALLVQLGRPDEAIQVLERNRSRISNQQSVDNMLIGFYQNAEQHDKAIALLQKKLGQATTESKKVQILWQIAIGYLRKEDYAQAEQTFRKVLLAQRDNRNAQRNIALCLFKQERYEEAQQILNRILLTTPDPQAAELLEAIRQAQSGRMISINEIIVETALSDVSREISSFARFYLDRCDYQGVRPDHIQSQNFDRSDVVTLEQLATRSRTMRPRERASYYLSAAKITSLLEDEDPNQFYKYLCRSFASSGDAIVVENRPLDAAREYYGESLSVYDGDRSRSRDEQDAVNALVRFLFSTMGQSQIPIKPNIPTIDETLEFVLTRHPDRNKVFDAVAYLVFRSRYAANRLLNRIYEKSSLQAMALEYLRSTGIPVGTVKRLEDFVRLWNDLVRRKLDENRSLLNEIRTLAQVELTVSSLTHGIERIKTITGKLFFDLDQQRALQIQRILETALELCNQTAFEEKERLCIQIENRCRDLLGEIEASPTKISVEEIYPLVNSIQEKVRFYLAQLYDTSTPQLTLRLPVETYTPDTSRRIEVQVVVSNRTGCSPAEALELVVQQYEGTFSVRLEGSLRGGEQRILKVPVQLSEEALSAQAFSLPIYAHYRTRSGEIQQTVVNNFSIRLSAEEKFEEIDNPYAPYAEGGIVGEPAMFYGRDELIANVAKVLDSSRAQSKCVVIYGQKRAGKSSILYHLKERLKSIDDLLVLDIGNVGAILDEHSNVPFLYQILWTILKELRNAIEDKLSEGKSSLDISFPTDIEFYQHSSPLILFREVFERFRRATTKVPEWRGVRNVLLIDEFSYIYGYILNGMIPETFMKNWKALLQDNFFNAVLVGQDVMPKFKQRFPNEFGTTQDERVTYLRREDAIRLIDEPIRIGGRFGESRYRERAIERVLELTAGSPFYIQILCNRLVEYMNRKRASLVTEADVERVKDELICGVNALGKDKFDNLINSGDTSQEALSDEDTSKVLIAIAENSRTGPCSRSNIACETAKAVDEILEDLVRRDVIERERGHYYSIRVGLFREWLLAHR
ncbi:MAG: tetratricopeptide repeat protein [Meiothermus ruber]|uniref:tetratricopeptide repeat protein n=1 Tax=Meiothermus ruber TaxID=277 RepID=UPI003919026A